MTFGFGFGFSFQVDQIKDKLEDLEEQYIEVNRLHKDRCKVGGRYGHEDVMVAVPCDYQ